MEEQRLHCGEGPCLSISCLVIRYRVTSGTVGGDLSTGGSGPSVCPSSASRAASSLFAWGSMYSSMVEWSGLLEGCRGVPVIIEIRWVDHRCSARTLAIPRARITSPDQTPMKWSPVITDVPRYTPSHHLRSSFFLIRLGTYQNSRSPNSATRSLGILPWSL